MFWLKVLYSRWSYKDGLQIATYTWEHPAMTNTQNLSHQGSIFNFLLLQNDTQRFTTKQLSKFHINKDLKEINAITLQCLFGCHIKVQVLDLTNIYNCVTFASFKRSKQEKDGDWEKCICCFTIRQWQKWTSICFKPDSSWKIMYLSLPYFPRFGHSSLLSELSALQGFHRLPFTSSMFLSPENDPSGWPLDLPTRPRNALNCLMTLFSKRESHFSKWKLNLHSQVEIFIDFKLSAYFLFLHRNEGLAGDLLITPKTLRNPVWEKPQDSLTAHTISHQLKLILVLQKPSKNHCWNKQLHSKMVESTEVINIT